MCIGIAIGNLVISPAIIVEIVDILGTTGLVLVFLKVVAHGVHVVPYFAWVRILIDGHAEIDIRIRRVNIQRFFDFVPSLSKIESVYVVCGVSVFSCGGWFTAAPFRVCAADRVHTEDLLS